MNTLVSPPAAPGSPFGWFPRRRIFTLIELVTGVWLALQSPLAAAPDEATAIWTIPSTADQRSFTCEVVSRETRAGYQLLHLRFPSAVTTAVPQNNWVPARLFLPNNLPPDAPRRPGVICLPILNGDEALTSAVCAVLVQRGIPALMFTLPYYGERGTTEGRRMYARDVQTLLEGLEQTLADIRRATDLLASRPEVDPQRLGITGISFGGILAATAAGLDARLQRVGLLLAGGDLPTLIREAPETREWNARLTELAPAERAAVDARLRALDPLTLAPALRDRARQGRVLMINAAEDEVVSPDCTRKLAAALGLTDQVIWLEGLGHYTAMAELPRALRRLGDFFAQDLPPGLLTETRPAAATTPGPWQQLAGVAHQLLVMLTTPPPPRRCHFLEAGFTATNQASRVTTGAVRLVVGDAGRFSLRCELPSLGTLAAGQDRYPWLASAPERARFAGTLDPVTNQTAWSHLAPEHLVRYRMLAGAVATILLVPDLAQKWVTVERDKTAPPGQGVCVALRNGGKTPGRICLTLAEAARTPTHADFEIGGWRGRVRLHGWQTNTLATDALFAPPPAARQQAVTQADVYRMFSAVLNFAGEMLDNPASPTPSDPPALSVVARDPSGHGLLCRQADKNILIVQGTPAQMGAAHGALLGAAVRRTTERVVYGVGTVDTVQSGHWFPDVLASIERRTRPHLPARFIEECDALADAAGLSRRDVRYANLFPERFHCSGVAVRGRATPDGRVLQARVLDYLRDIGLQRNATVMVFLPEDRHAWMSLGYAGFIGTVTAMNEKGLTIGEMGGRGEGQWDGQPMSVLLREVMERAATVDEALALIQATPRTCEYYYVVSDPSGAMLGLSCRPETVEVLKPGQQHPALPEVPEDTVLMSAGERAEILSQRLRAHYGRIDAARLREIIKRPVAMKSNLHNAIFSPTTLEMWFADAGRTTPACDEPYARVQLDTLIQFYKTAMADNGHPPPAR